MRRRLSFWRTAWRWTWRLIVLVTVTWLVLDFFGHGLTWGETAHKFTHAPLTLWQHGDPRAVHRPAVLLPLQLPDLLRADDGHGHLQIRATSPATRSGASSSRTSAARPRRRRRSGASSRSGSPASVRAGGRQARARPAVPGRAGHRQDDAGEGDRDRLQLPVRDDPRLRLRPDLHRAGRDPRPLPRAEGKRLARKWGGQCIVFIDEIDAVGMRRERASVRRQRRDLRESRTPSSSRATSCSRRARGANKRSREGRPSVSPPSRLNHDRRTRRSRRACSAGAAAAWRSTSSSS